MMSDTDGDVIDVSEIKSKFVLDFFDLWSARCSEDHIPARNSFDFECLQPWLGNIQIMEVVAGGQDFLHKLIGTNIVDMIGRDLSGKLVSECDYEIGANQMLERYRFTMSMRKPVFRRGKVLWKEDRSWLNFEMVTAPLSNGGTNVDQLISILWFANFE
jgi:hypothetical protein